MSECKELDFATYRTLIACVKKEPFLYDNQIKEHHCVYVVRDKWREIAPIVGMSVLWCKVTWNHLFHMYKYRNSKSTLHIHMDKYTRYAINLIDFITHFGDGVLISQLSFNPYVPESSIVREAECKESGVISDSDEDDSANQDPSESTITPAMPLNVKVL